MVGTILERFEKKTRELFSSRKWTVDLNCSWTLTSLEHGTRKRQLLILIRRDQGMFILFAMLVLAKYGAGVSFVKVVSIGTPDLKLLGEVGGE